MRMFTFGYFAVARSIPEAVQFLALLLHDSLSSQSQQTYNCLLIDSSLQFFQLTFRFINIHFIAYKNEIKF